MRTAYINNFLKRWTLLAAVAIMLLMNYLANAIPFGGNSMAEMSAKYATLITPAGYAFSIWGLIYFTLAVFAVFQLNKGKNTRFYSLVWPYFILNVIANISWLFAFQNDLIALSVVLMALILGSLIVILGLFYRLRKSMGTTHRYFFQVPFSLYFGWITVASIVNVAAFLVSAEIAWVMARPELFAVIMLSIGVAISLYMLLSHGDYIYVFAVVWAYVAIWVARAEAGDLVMQMAKFSAFGLLAAAAITFIADRIKVSQYGRQAS